MSMTPHQLIILDRDGVINHDSDQYIKSLDEWIPYPSAIEAIARLSQHGFIIAIATNQSGIARGYYDEHTLAAMDQRLNILVNRAGGKIAYIAYCPHGPDDQCHCRKPKPGLLQQIQHGLQLPTLQGSWMVGDSLRDLQAGESQGCFPILVRTGKGQKTEEKQEGLATARIFDDLASFTDWLLISR